MKFADITGHESVKAQLRALVDTDRIPHALLLQGPEGIGKFSMARALAQYIHCTSRTSDGDSCGRCPACLQHQSFNHVDTHFTFPVIKKDSHATSDDFIKEWREFLNESPYMDFELWREKLGKKDGRPIIYVDESAALMRKLNFTAHAAHYMLSIIWLPERMKEECANKLLKIIEEPHPDTIFIFVSDYPSEILPTIYSRLQRIDMKRLPDALVADYLTQNLAVEPDAAADIAHLSEGSILNAMRRISIADENADNFDAFVKLMRLAYQRNIAELKKWSEKMAALGRERLMNFLDYCERLTGENFLYNLQQAELVYLDRQEAAFSSKFARFISERNVEGLRQLFIDARTDIGGNANPKIVMFTLAVHTIMLIKQ